MDALDRLYALLGLLRALAAAALFVVLLAWTVVCADVAWHGMLRLNGSLPLAPDLALMVIFCVWAVGAAAVTQIMRSCWPGQLWR